MLASIQVGAAQQHGEQLGHKLHTELDQLVTALAALLPEGAAASSLITGLAKSSQLWAHTGHGDAEDGGFEEGEDAASTSSNQVQRPYQKHSASAGSGTAALQQLHALVDGVAVELSRRAAAAAEAVQRAVRAEELLQLKDAEARSLEARLK